MKLIAKTTTAKRLEIICRLDRRRCPVGKKVTDAEFATVRLYPKRFHGDWTCAVPSHP